MGPGWLVIDGFKCHPLSSDVSNACASCCQHPHPFRQGRPLGHGPCHRRLDDSTTRVLEPLILLKDSLGYEEQILSLSFLAGFDQVCNSYNIVCDFT